MKMLSVIPKKLLEFYDPIIVVDSVPILSSTSYGVHLSKTLSILDSHSHNLCEVKYPSEIADWYRSLKNCYVKLLRSKHLVIDSGIICIEQGSPNYYHFVLDVLPNLLCLKANAEKINYQYRHVIIGDAPIFAKEFILELKIVKNEENIKAVRYNPHFVKSGLIEREYFASKKTIANQLLPEKISTLRHFVLSSSKITSSRKELGQKKWVFIERRISNNGGNLRKLFPQDEFHAYLQKRHGFKIIYFEDLTPWDQIYIFQNSELIVACHGAALTNLIFAGNNLTLIELGHHKGFPDYFKKIAQHVKLKRYTQLTVNSYWTEKQEEETKEIYDLGNNTNFYPLAFDTEFMLKFEKVIKSIAS